MKPTLKKKICNIICIVIILTICFPHCVSFASDIMFDLDSLGITKMVNTNDKENKNISRGEFVQLSVNLMRQTELANSMKTNNSYSDIEKSPYNGAINLLYSQGVLSDFSKDSLFYPERPISLVEANKILVRVIGYEVIMTDQSDVGYYNQATKLGINKNVSNKKESITYYDALNMIYNCLSVKALEISYNTAKSSYKLSDETIFENIYQGRSDKVTKMKGIVTADSKTYLYSQRDTMKDNQIEINGKLFDCLSVPPTGLVGMEVEIYVSEDEDIISMRTTEKNNVVEILGSDIDNFDSNELKYSKDEMHQKKVKLNQTTKYIYNNNLNLYFNPNELVFNNLLTIRTIDNNDDGIVDVVFVFEYTDAVVKKVYNESKTLGIDKKYNGSENVCLDDENKDINVEIFSEDGTLACIDDISEGDVVSLATSKDGYSIRVVYSKKSVTGYVRETYSDYIVIDDVKYRFVNGISKITGKTICAKLDFFGNVTDYEISKENRNFAFIYDVAVGSHFDEVYIKAILPENVASKTIEGAFDESTNSLSSATNLYVNNADIKKYKLSDKVNVNGKKYNNDLVIDMIKHKAVSLEFKDDLVTKINYLNPLYEYELDSITGRYKVNNDGEYFIQSQTLDQKMYYNSNERVFAGGSCLPFAIDDSTLAVCVPVNNVISDRNVTYVSNEELLNFKMELTNNSAQYVSAYEVDEDSHISQFIVINQNASAMQISDRGTIKVGKKYVGLVLMNPIFQEMDFRGVLFLKVNIKKDITTIYLNIWKNCSSKKEIIKKQE